MKKLLIILGALSMGSLSALSVVSCTNNTEETNKNKDEQHLHPEFAKLIAMNKAELDKAHKDFFEWADKNKDDYDNLDKVHQIILDNDTQLPKNLSAEKFSELYDIILKSHSFVAITTPDVWAIISLQKMINKEVESTLISKDQILWLTNLQNYSENKLPTLKPIEETLHPEFRKFIAMSKEELQVEFDDLEKWANSHILNQQYFQKVLQTVLNNDTELPENFTIELFLEFYHRGLKWYTITAITSNDPTIIESLKNDLKKSLTSVFMTYYETIWLNNIIDYIEEKLPNMEPLPPKEVHPKLQAILDLDKDEFLKKYQELKTWYNAEENQQNIKFIFLIIESNLSNQVFFTDEEFKEYYQKYLDYFIYSLIAITDRDLIFDYLDHLQVHLENKLVTDDNKALINDVNTYIIDLLMSGEK